MKSFNLSKKKKNLLISVHFETKFQPIKIEFFTKSIKSSNSHSEKMKRKKYHQLWLNMIYIISLGHEFYNF